MQYSVAMPFLILGAGYVGSRLHELHPDSVATHRQARAASTNLAVFRLEAPATWDNVEWAGRDVVLTFPALALPLVEELWVAKLSHARSVIALGSTSAYAVRKADQLVTEEAALDLTQERVRGEEWLRGQGAMVLRLAGIFGPQREPLAWLRRGLIKNGSKRVNLIHVDDIIAAIEAVTEKPEPGLVLNVSNGRSAHWRDIAAAYAGNGELGADFVLPEFPAGPDSKQIANERLKAWLPGRIFAAPPGG